jgi:hypothetical protein
MHGDHFAEALIAHDIPLRPDLTVRIVLPVRLTEADADRLCEVIRSLTFPADALIVRDAVESVPSLPEETPDAG